MTERYISYSLNGDMYDVPESESAGFEKRNPSAKIEMHIGNDIYDVPLSEKDGFLSRNGDKVSYLFGGDDSVSNKSVSRDSEKDDKTNVFETIGKGLGAAGVGTAKLALDLGQFAWENTLGLFDGQRYSSELQDTSNPVTRASMKLGELQERLSREADPTGGQMGFGELLKEGKVGMALQKALGSGLESLPMMVAAGTGVGSLVYGAALAAGNYADETRENPDIPAWKRGINSVGSAALEMAVEKIGGPLKNLGGKAAKEITEETATEILKDFAKEGTETVSKRIFNTLKKIGKEGIEEGTEEVLTSFGNDALGEALDLIDGDKDYGIRAQWEQTKKQNPKADLGDFAAEKAKEYFDAFLGGALSGMEISGATETFSEIGRYRRGVGLHNEIEQLRAIGANATEGDLYEINSTVNEFGNNVEKAFTDADGNPKVSRDFINSLDAEQAFVLSRSEGITAEQSMALNGYAKAKAAEEGFNQKYDALLSEKINNQNQMIEQATENGSIVTGLYNGNPVFVKGGVVNNGSISLPNGGDGPVVVIDAITGEKATANSKDIQQAVSQNSDEYRVNLENQTRQNDAHNRDVWRNTVNDSAKLNDIKQYDNSKILIKVGEALVQVQVQKITQDGQVLIKGKKGDLGGQSEVMMPAAQFYDSIARNEDGTPVFVEALPQREQTVAEPVAEPEAQTVEAEGPQDFREFADTIVINGVPVNVEVTEQDDTQDKITYTYVNENGQPKVGFATVADFANAVKQAEQLKAEAPKVEVPTENATSTVDETTTQTTTETPEVEIPDSDENINLEPESIDFDALFETDKEAFFNEIQNQFGEESVDILNEFINAAQQELDALNKAKAKGKNGILESRKAKLKLQEEIDSLNGMVARLNPAPETTEGVAAGPVEESVPEPVVEQVAESAGTPISEITELPEEPVVGRQKDAEPMNGVEFAARELGLKDGGIKLLWDSFKHHTGYGNAERSKFFGLFRTKEKGGMTLEEAGERLMELDRENQTGFFDQSDSNAGLNAILDAISSNNTIGELRSYAARMRHEEAQREADAAYSAMMFDHEQTTGESMEDTIHYNQVAKEELAKNALSDEEFNEYNAILAEEYNQYGTGTIQGETARVSENENEGDLQPATRGMAQSGEGSNTILQGESPVLTRGEETGIIEGETADSVNIEDANTPVPPSEQTSEVEFESVLDEDMPDFTGEEAKTPVAPNPVDNPVREAQKREKSIVTQLKRLGISHEAKQDMAYNAGKNVGDFFATREDYEAYEENATDLGEFNSDFERGVNYSFEKRAKTLGVPISANTVLYRKGDSEDGISENNSVSLPSIESTFDSGEWSDEANVELNNIVNDVTSGLAILKRYTPQEHRGLLRGGELLVGASILSRGNKTDISETEGTFEALKEKSNKTIPIITEWAKSIGVWREYSDRSEAEISRDYLDSGSEAQVFNLGDGKVEKIIGLDYYVDPQLAIDRIAIHNALFPDTNLEVVGFGTNKHGDFAIIVHQNVINAAPTPQDEIDAYVESLGFTKVNDEHHTFVNDELYVSDLHQDNVLSNDDTKYYVIDGDFRLNTAEAGEGGTRKVDDSIVRTDGNDILSRKEDAQNAAIEYLAGDARFKAIENAVNEEAKKLGVKITYKTREQMPDGHKADKGYYNTETGEIVICAENASSVADAIQTILHESVAHKGLRQLMGDKFDEFISRVYNRLDAETKAKVDKVAEKHYNGNTAVAMEEYMASLAEDGKFNSIWEKIKSIFNDILNKILGRNDIEIGDNELRYLLRASYNNMLNPRGMESLEGWAKDMMMREEYGINKLNTQAPTILSRTGIDPTEVSRETAAQVYDREVKSTWNEFQRQFQDAFQPVRIAIDAIQQETGNAPVEDYENYLLAQNQSSSRSRVEIDKFSRRYYSPIIKQVNKIIDKIMESRGLNPKDKAQRAEVYKEVRNYLVAKHGIERNKYYQEHRTRNLTAKEMRPLLDEAQKNYEYDVNLINMDATLTDAERELKLREANDQYNAIVTEIENRQVPDMRDYSGLTALFNLGSKKYKEAERQAQELVDAFESEIETDALWSKINAATNKTLRHSYESGLLSRQQYEDIKNMFKFYIPLRGFDETTAEDVYAYARFEGNRFNPAVQKAGGRTSLADDPLAIIMNMAESEIAQGNKNRAKQTLYNYLLNRASDNNEQNSLMQIEDVWYVKGVDDNGNKVFQIAAPDHEKGQTYEEFENDMQAKAEKGDAYKSKKGKVDIGLRFQKQASRNAHYVYLKVNGVEKAIYVNGDPKIADAINGKGTGQLGEGAKKFRDAQRIISSTFTNYSLDFTARNYFRDMIYSHINIGVRESDPAYRKKFRQNWRQNNMKTMLSLLKAYRAGEFDVRALTETEAAFVDFMENGGQTGYTLINSVENHKKDLERAIKKMQEGIEKGGVKDSTIFKATLGGIELLNEASELVTRFAAFKTSRDMGRSVVKSISDAKEITVNFNTKGAQDGKGWMGFIAQYFGWSKFFFNASVQGVQNIKAMKDANWLKFCGVVGGTIATGFLMPVFVGAIAEILGGDDDDEYWNIPEYDRQNNLCIPLGGGKYAKVPLPIGFREVYALGDMVAAMLMDKKFTRDFGQVGMDMANKIASVILPINPLESSANGLSIWHTGLYTVLPSSLQFAVQNATNVDWKGAPLQKEYTYNENDPQWMKAFNSNPDWMTGLSKWCNEHLNLDGDYKGMDWSPEKLDNILSNLLGGVYSLVKKTGRSVSMIWNEENRNLSNVPLAGVALGSGIDNDDRFITDAYYDMQGYYDENVNYIKRRAEKFGYTLDDVFMKEKGKYHPKMLEIYENKNFDFMQEWYKGNDELNDINKEIKKLKKQIAEKENPSMQLLEKLAKKESKFEAERRDFVNDMLELD